MQATNKTFIVTGAGSGIGRELSLLLLRKGARVAGVDIHENTLQETQNLAGVGDDRFRGYVIDITDKSRVEALPKQVQQDLGSLDGIINNAGIIQPFKPVKSLSQETMERVLNVNFWGTVYLSQAALPMLLERPEAHIVNISSMGGFLPVPGQTIYGAAKAAVKLFTEGLYAELKETSVGVTVVFPGAIATNITENSGIETPNVEGDAGMEALPAPKAAEIIIGAMEKGKFRVTVGKDAGFLDKLYRLSPGYAVNFIQKKMKALTKDF